MTKLCKLPDSIKDMNCYSNNLAEIPNFPANLISMDCHNNQIKKIPPFPENLKSIYISENELVELPEQSHPLNKLKTLYVENNKLTNINLSYYPNLISFNCDDNPLEYPQSFYLKSSLDSDSDFE